MFGRNILNEKMVRKQIRAFKNGRTNEHNVDRSERFSVIKKDFGQKVDGKANEKRRFKISSL